jgi:uncharacterized protein (TIGR00369 family)
MNAIGVLNGGASASLVTLAGTLAAWTGVDLDAAPDLSCVDLTMQYLAAAADGDAVAEATVLRRGREVIFLDVAVRSRAGAAICRGTLTYQAVDYAGRAPRTLAAHQPPPAPSPLVEPAGRRLFRGYVGSLGIAPVHQSPGRSLLRMPCAPELVDERGHLHAGALASIVDIAAVAASWALIPKQPGTRGSTVSMQVSFPTLVRDDVIADALVQQRSEALLFNTVHVTTASGQLAALGLVSYRLLEPRPTS